MVGQRSFTIIVKIGKVMKAYIDWGQVCFLLSGKKINDNFTI